MNSHILNEKTSETLRSIELFLTMLVLISLVAFVCLAVA
jgi:hypothetical protein